jgi:hypothetical protein
MFRIANGLGNLLTGGSKFVSRKHRLRYIPQEYHFSASGTRFT